MAFLRAVNSVCLPSLCFVTGGCINPIPVGVFPAEGIASGKTVQMTDQSDARLQLDGHIIVVRERSLRYFSCRHVEVESKLIEVKAGEARLPGSNVLASVWLHPNEFCIGMTLAGASTGNPRAIALLPATLIPIPMNVPGDHVILIPLISGHYPTDGPCSVSFAEAGYGANRPGTGTIRLAANSKDIWKAKAHLECVQGNLKPSTFKASHDYRSEVILCDKDFALARAFIDRELGKLFIDLENQKMQDPQPPTTD